MIKENLVGGVTRVTKYEDYFKNASAGQRVTKMYREKSYLNILKERLKKPQEDIKIA